MCDPVITGGASRRLGARAAFTALVVSCAACVGAASPMVRLATDETTPSPGPNRPFVDEFDGSSVTPTRWSTCHWWGIDGCTIASNDELEWYLPSQVTVRDGVLRLRADKGPSRSPDGRELAYRSGMISGFDGPGHVGVVFTYGRIEARVRVPVGAGLWPAIWLLPSSRRSEPEIDVMEVDGADPRTASMHLHYRDEDGSYDLGRESTGDDLSVGWHTVAVDWSPGLLVWSVDDVERWRVEGNMVPHEPMYVVANLAVGGTFVGDPTASTVFPSDFLVDMIEVRSPAS